MKWLLVLFAPLALTISLTAQDKYYAFIKGVVVNEKGHPVYRAAITFDNSDALKDKKCWVKDDSLLSDGAGQFLHNEYCGVANRTIVLFTEATTGGVNANNAKFPIYFPYWPELRRSNPKFAGLPVELKGNQQIDLGKIPVQVWYNRVEFFVLGGNKRPFYKTEDDWARFELIVRDKFGTAVGSGGLSTYDIERSVRIDRGSVNLALPEGTWTLELLRNLDDFDSKGRTLRYLAKTTILVKRTDVCAQAHLVVK